MACLGLAGSMQVRANNFSSLGKENKDSHHTQEHLYIQLEYMSIQLNENPHNADVPGD